jgi:hypothetical protein
MICRAMRRRYFFPYLACFARLVLSRSTIFLTSPLDLVSARW